MCINDASLLAFFLVHLHSASRSVSSFKLVYGAGDRTRTALKGVGGERGGGGGCCWSCGVKSGLSMYAGSFVGLIGWGSNVGNATQMHPSGEVHGAVFFFPSSPNPLSPRAHLTHSILFTLVFLVYVLFLVCISHLPLLFPFHAHARERERDLRIYNSRRRRRRLLLLILLLSPLIALALARGSDRDEKRREEKKPSLTEDRTPPRACLAAGLDQFLYFPHLGIFSFLSSSSTSCRRRRRQGCHP